MTKREGRKRGGGGGEGRRKRRSEGAVARLHKGKKGGCAWVGTNSSNVGFFPARVGWGGDWVNIVLESSDVFTDGKWNSRLFVQHGRVGLPHSKGTCTTTQRRAPLCRPRFSALCDRGGKEEEGKGQQRRRWWELSFLFASDGRAGRHGRWAHGQGKIQKELGPACRLTRARSGWLELVETAHGAPKACK